MKHFFKGILTAALVALPCVATAQKHFDANIAVGGKAGVSLSRVTFSPSVPQSWLMGTTVGATFRYVEEKNFGLIAELNFVQQGWKEDFKGAPYAFSRQLNYINVPLLSHIYFGSPKVKGFFNLGPEISYMISESSSYNFDMNNLMALPDFPDNRYTAQMTLPIKNKFTYGITVGAGIEFTAARKHSVNLEGRFSYGLGNVFGSRKKDIFSASSNMSIMVTAGYNFRIK